MDKKTTNKQPKKPEAETRNNDTEKAHRQADKDIASDAELSAHSPNDDLDEGESARLGEDVPI